MRLRNRRGGARTSCGSGLCRRRDTAQRLYYRGLERFKKLSEKKRDLLFDEIKEHAVYAVASASVEEIDEMNILNATFLAMRRTFDALPERPQAAFVDGNRLPGLPVPSKAIVKGDSLSASIAAASIMAKVSRDRYMLSLDEQYPEYCFKKHKGCLLYTSPSPRD